MYTDDDLHRAEEHLLASVNAAWAPYPADQRVDQVTQHGLREAAVRMASWYLTDRHQFHFDTAWQLTAQTVKRPVVASLG